MRFNHSCRFTMLAGQHGALRVCGQTGLMVQNPFIFKPEFLQKTQVFVGDIKPCRAHCSSLAYVSKCGVSTGCPCGCLGGLQQPRDAAHPVCTQPACLACVARQDAEPVNHCVAAPLRFPVAAVSHEVTSAEFIWGILVIHGWRTTDTPAGTTDSEPSESLPVKSMYQSAAFLFHWL